jgi:putative endonuclease
MSYFAYFLRCADGSLYAGYTVDLEARLAKHNQGVGSKYTRTRLPVRLVFASEFVTKSEALSFEAKMKRMSKAEKEQLVKM